MSLPRAQNVLDPLVGLNLPSDPDCVSGVVLLGQVMLVLHKEVHTALRIAVDPNVFTRL